MSITRRLAAALAIGALVAPAAAQAKPMDMHASTAIAAVQARETQDLRSADARDAAAHPRRAGHPVNAPGATAVDSASSRSAAGPSMTTAQPATIADDASSTNWTTIALGIAGSLIAVGALAATLSRRSRQTRRVRAAA